MANKKKKESEYQVMVGSCENLYIPILYNWVLTNDRRLRLQISDYHRSKAVIRSHIVDIKLTEKQEQDVLRLAEIFDEYKAELFEGKHN